MTYGWAVVIVLAVLAVLFYVGVFNSPGSAPSSCVFPAGFTCSEFRVDEYGNLYLDLGQATGRTVTVTAIGCSGSDAPSFTEFPSVAIPSGGHAVVSGAGVPCVDATGPFKGKVSIQYTVAGSGLARNITATLTSPMSATGAGYGGDRVLMLHLDNNPALGENATKFVDVSGYGNNATCSNCPAFTSDGKIGGAYMFDGVDDKIDVGNAASLNITNALSIEAWIRSNQTYTDKYRELVGKPDYGKYSLFVEWSTGGGYVRFEIDNASSRYILNGPSFSGNVGTWMHICGTYDSSEGILRLYHNGTLYGTKDIGAGKTIDTTSGHVYVGGRNTYVFNGTIDEVRIYSRALSPDEVLAHYQAGAD